MAPETSLMAKDNADKVFLFNERTNSKSSRVDLSGTYSHNIDSYL